MSTTQRKSQQRSAAAARRRQIGSQLSAMVKALDQTDAITRPAAELAAELVSLAALWRERMTDHDARMGALTAAYLTALDCGTTREEVAAWLQTVAGNLLRRRAPQPS